VDSNNLRSSWGIISTSRSSKEAVAYTYLKLYYRHLPQLLQQHQYHPTMTDLLSYVLSQDSFRKYSKYHSTTPE
jgi:hypothetical protein